MTVVMVYDKRYSCVSKTTVTRMHVTFTILIVHTEIHSFIKIYKKLYIISKIKIYMLGIFISKVRYMISYTLPH